LERNWIWDCKYATSSLHSLLQSTEAIQVLKSRLAPARVWSRGEEERERARERERKREIEREREREDIEEADDSLK